MDLVILVTERQQCFWLPECSRLRLVFTLLVFVGPAPDYVDLDASRWVVVPLIDSGLKLIACVFWPFVLCHETLLRDGKMKPTRELSSTPPVTTQRQPLTRIAGS